MITESFDVSSEPLMAPQTFYGKHEPICDTAVLTFSGVLFDEVIRNYPAEPIGTIHSCGESRDVYGVHVDGKTIAFYRSSIGSAMAATDVLDVNCITGATNFVLFGSAGALDSVKTAGKYVLPTESYRDEGMSYHYAPPADYIAIPGTERVAALFDGWGVPYVKGRVWTTDAFYRETRALTEKRRAEGCLAVEMETAGVQAVCSFHGFSLYAFLMTGDVLDAPDYQIANLSNANHSLQNAALALKIAANL